jgi:hypothetical protein
VGRGAPTLVALNVPYGDMPSLAGPPWSEGSAYASIPGGLIAEASTSQLGCGAFP